mmetsp:Transcript_17266/g.51691  ORF Transcript_17266/g.51691 Transcript_17266/m.51691 type:complete len:83 (-) Transcript_17266:945-1193(-)
MAQTAGLKPAGRHRQTPRRSAQLAAPDGQLQPLPLSASGCQSYERTAHQASAAAKHLFRCCLATVTERDQLRARTTKGTDLT